jgi:hypothetical protein
MKINDVDRLSLVFQKVMPEKQLPTRTPRDGSKAFRSREHQMDKERKDKPSIGKSPGKLTAAQKAQIRMDQESKKARALAAILAAHPKLTREEALEAMRLAGFL